MKTTFKGLLAPLSVRDLNQLTSEVREEIFMEEKHRLKRRQFSVAALWRIQKLKKAVRLIRH